MDNKTNYKIITAHKLTLGISLTSWAFTIVLTLVVFNILVELVNIMIAVGISIFIFLFIFIYLAIKTKKEPDYMDILIIKIFHIGTTTNKRFKGNCYVP
ncbi:MAG: hypothetical protein DRG78_00730 [Epsilonproteobacteria bacterium]|nr:MAG: hypothetical protein DRG78_00730 [Campylobacterota bacterium]